MTDQFCGNCGIRTDGNTDEETNTVKCTTCGQVIQFTLLSKPIKNYDEAQTIFEGTPLTDKKAVKAAKRKEIEKRQR